MNLTDNSFDKHRPRRIGARRVRLADRRPPAGEDHRARFKAGEESRVDLGAGMDLT